MTDQKLNAQLAAVRARLVADGHWPESADTLLNLLQASYTREFSEDDMDLLGLVVDDFLKGVDLEVQYPQVYQWLLHAAAYRAAFLDILELTMGEDGL